VQNENTLAVMGEAITEFASHVTSILTSKDLQMFFTSCIVDGIFTREANSFVHPINAQITPSISTYFELHMFSL
jgi:hypothetical protein